MLAQFERALPVCYLFSKCIDLTTFLCKCYYVKFAEPCVPFVVLHESTYGPFSEKTGLNDIT